MRKFVSERILIILFETIPILILALNGTKILQIHDEQVIKNRMLKYVDFCTCKVARVQNLTIFGHKKMKSDASRSSRIHQEEISK